MRLIQTKSGPPRVELDLSEYPVSDGKPMAETGTHLLNMFHVIGALRLFFVGRQVLVGGNQFLYYVPNNRRRHVAPDVYVTLGLPMEPPRDAYFLWIEGRAPDLVVEITSESTKDEDLEEKFQLYRNVLKVKEYVLFDPYGDYLDPQLQGYELKAGKFQRVKMKAGRLPSKVLDLHFERDGQYVRLWNPATSSWLPTDTETAKELERQRAQAEAERYKAEAERNKAERLAKRLRDLGIDPEE